MPKNLFTPLQAVVIACALTAGGSLIVTACAEQRITDVPALQGGRATSLPEVRMVLMRPVMEDGRPGYAPRTVILRPVPDREPWPAELGPGTEP